MDEQNFEFDENELYSVETIKDKRIINGKTEYSWEPEDSLEYPELIADFEKMCKIIDDISLPIEGFEDNVEAKVLQDNATVNYSKPNKKLEHPGDKEVVKTSEDKRTTRAIENKESELKKKSGNSREKMEAYGNGIQNTLDYKETKAKKKPESQKSITASHPFDKGYEPENIVGTSTTEPDQLMFHIKWKGTEDIDLVPAQDAYYKYPELVKEFLYENTKFKDKSYRQKALFGLICFFQNDFDFNEFGDYLKKC